MKHAQFLLFVCGCAVAVCLLDACSSTVDSGTKSPTDTTVRYDAGDTTRPPSVRRSYDSARGGVQIAAIYYDQDQNNFTFKVHDEWIILQSQRPTRTAGWKLNAGDVGQDYPLPDTIAGTLTIYTHNGPTNPTGASIALHIAANRWIWNNTDPDTARVFDEKDALVSAFTYDVK